jgi:hypothetical protein
VAASSPYFLHWPTANPAKVKRLVNAWRAIPSSGFFDLLQLFALAAVLANVTLTSICSFFGSRL